MLIVFFRAVILYILIVISMYLMEPADRRITALRLVIAFCFQTSPPCLSRI